MMLNLSALLCTITFLTAIPQEPYPGFERVSDIQAFEKEFKALSSGLESFSSAFVQEKTLSALTETITSEGKLWYQRTDKVRMDYTTPFFYQVIINGDRMSVRDEQKQTTFSASSNRMLQQINRIMIDCIRGSILQSKDFSSRVFENERAYLLEMKPENKTMKQFLDGIVLIVEKKSGTPESITLMESSGDKTVLKLSNKQVNAKVDNEIFTF